MSLKHRTRIGWVWAWAWLAVAAASPTRAAVDTNGVAHARYIFLFIGDGMGVGQRQVGDAYVASRPAAQAAAPVDRLLMNRLPVSSLTTTSDVRGRVTDSAASGTALACGEKTSNGTIGMAPDHRTKLKSLAYAAQARGMGVGILTTAPIDHATPACFYASVPNRNSYYEITEQLPASGFDFFAGDAPLAAGRGGSRKPILEVVQEGGYRVVDFAQRETLRAGDRKVFLQGGVGAAISHPKGLSGLEETLRTAIAVLDRPEGFFIMAEGGMIDWMGHANDVAAAVKQVVAFDAAVAVAYAFAQAHPKETLIIVTGDHETGGLTLDRSDPARLARFAAHIDSQKRELNGLSDVAEAWRKNRTPFDQALASLHETFGFADLSPEDAALLRQVYDGWVRDPEAKDERPSEQIAMYGTKDPLPRALSAIMARRVGAAWTGKDHTGAAVPTTALGPGADRLAAPHDNTDIARLLRAVIEAKR